MRLIDADVLDDAMYHEAFENDSSYDERNPMARWDSGLWIRYKMFENAIADAPTIEPKRGEWIRAINDYDQAYHNYCSLCREWNGMDVEGWNWTPNFCPNCGADMREREGE